jgi:hypothetical protein
MSVRASYVLRIGGRLSGAPNANREAIQAFHKVLPPKPPKGKGQGWPEGFVLPGYRICQWRSEAERGGQEDQTRLSFRAEVTLVVSGAVYDNRAPLLRHVAWFYGHRAKRWHKQLKARLLKLNQDYVTARGHETVIEQIWFREWQWYCGNGGDM